MEHIAPHDFIQLLIEHISYTDLQIAIYQALSAVDPAAARTHREAMERAYPKASFQWDRK